LRKGALEMAALTALWGRGLYGLDIIRFLEERSQLVLSQGKIYPILSRLKAEGLLGVRVLKTPVQAPKANAHCERLVGTTRWECLDYVMPMNERHLRCILEEFVGYYNRGGPHSSLGPGIPEPNQAEVPSTGDRHQLPVGYRIKSSSVTGGLHHEYRLEREVT
jgi:transposase InsO family protein